MKLANRLTIATVLGLLFGFVCYGLASSAPGGVPLAVALQLIASRALLGFGIGISRLRMGHWSIHGLVMGIIFSIPLAFGALLAPDSPEFNKTTLFVMTIVMGMIYGVLIELITSVLFKARMEKPVEAHATV